jgi:hypothetical protein
MENSLVKRDSAKLCCENWNTSLILALNTWRQVLCRLPCARKRSPWAPRGPEIRGDFPR